jgi:PAS domain S-box-containing protein
VGKTDLDLWPRDLAEKYRTDDDQVMRSQQQKRVEERMVDHLGNESWIETIKNPIFDESGKVVGTIGIARDITERKRIEEALHQEKHFTDKVIDSMPGIFYVFDEQGRLTRWNKRLEHISGYTEDEIGRMTALDFCVPEDRNKAMEAIKDVFIKGESGTEARFLSKDGKTVPLYLTGVRITIGKDAYLLGAGFDISERILAEAESARLQVLLRSVILQSTVPMVLTLPDGTVEL